MLFRPRIFISSTFKENEGTRKKLEEIFTDFGAEPLLYESVLTPSVLPLTYRQNVLDSDFIILILNHFILIFLFLYLLLTLLRSACYLVNGGHFVTIGI